MQEVLDSIIQIVFQEVGQEKQKEKRQKKNTPTFDYSTQMIQSPVTLVAKCKETVLVPFAHMVERHCWDWGLGMVDHALLLKGLNTWQRAIVHNVAEVICTGGGKNEFSNYNYVYQQQPQYSTKSNCETVIIRLPVFPMNHAA